MPELPKPTPTIVFFDGICGFCDHSVTFLFKRDTHHALRFAPLQGETAQLYVSEAKRRNLDSLVLLYDDKIYERSTAALKALYLTGGCGRVVAGLLLLVPTPIRDFFYGFTRYRYVVFGKRDSCRLIKESERGFFLD